jgi:hypothetical protein
MFRQQLGIIEYNSNPRFVGEEVVLRVIEQTGRDERNEDQHILPHDETHPASILTLAYEERVRNEWYSTMSHGELNAAL